MTAPLVVLIAAFSLYSLPSHLRCIHLGLVVIGASLIVQALIRGGCTKSLSTSEARPVDVSG